MPDVTLPAPLEPPAEAYPWKNPLEWLLNSDSDNAPDFEAALQALVMYGVISNDDVQNIWQDNMEDDNYFLPTAEWMLANVSTAGMVQCDYCGEVFGESDPEKDMTCSASELEDARERDVPHALDVAELENVRQWCEDNFPDDDQRQEFYDYGAERGWWK